MELLDTLLFGVYANTYLAASIRDVTSLILTLVGGGVFHNPLPNIIRAIALAHINFWRLCPQLEEVYLPLYGPSIPPNTIVDMLISHGIKPTQIEIIHI